MTVDNRSSNLPPLRLSRLLNKSLSITSSRLFMSAFSSLSKPTNGSKILSKTTLPAQEAKWTKLTKINWQDPSGKQRIWESAERSTRSKGGVDGLHLGFYEGNV
jgi:hypothetical protein